MRDEWVIYVAGQPQYWIGDVQDSQCVSISQNVIYVIISRITFKYTNF